MRGGQSATDAEDGDGSLLLLFLDAERQRLNTPPAALFCAGETAVATRNDPGYSGVPLTLRFGD